MRRLNLILSEDAFRNLEELRQNLGKSSKADVLRSAVAFMEYIEQQKAAGKQITVSQNGQIEKELIIL